MSRPLDPSVPLVTLVKTEPLTVIKNEALEEALEKGISPDIKGIDIVYHSLSEGLIKNETVLENILETKYSGSVEKQVLVKTEDTSDENVTRGTDQEVIEVQDLNVVGTSSRKAKHAKKTDFDRYYKTDGITSWEQKDKKKIKVIKAAVIPVEAHEYTSLANDRHVCNHCQHVCKLLSNLKKHIGKIHREVTTMYQCPYCPYKSKWSIRNHIILKHKDTKDIQWFLCNLCEMKFKLKGDLTRHMKVHLRHEQMKDKLNLREKGYHCDKCDYKTYTSTNFKRHKFNHLKPEDIPYVHCYHCSYKSKFKGNLQNHIFTHLKDGEVKFNC